MESFWRPLNLSQNVVGSPPLLIKYEFGPSNYSVLFTDLTYLWAERLDRKEILRRALALDPSIDPSEDADQMQQFLRNLRVSLAGTKGTSLSLSPGDTVKQLVLNIRTPLPAPLEPLEWPISLTPAAQNIFTSEFVLPCLSMQLNAKAQIDFLLQALKDKDHVINRLTQKLQSDGSDFSKIFPAVAVSNVAKRLDSREYYAKLVKGLGAFDEEQWRTSTATQSSNLSDICSGVFATGTAETPNAIFRTSDFNNWWDRFSDEWNLGISNVSQALDDRLVPKQNVIVPKDHVDFDNEFQKKSIPLGLKASANARQSFSMANTGEEPGARAPGPRSADGDSTTDEDDEEPVSAKAECNSGRSDSVIVEDAGDADGEPRPGSSLKIKHPIELNSGLENSMDDGILPSNFARKNKRQEESISANDDLVPGESNETHSAPKQKAKLGKIGGKRKLPDEPSESLSQLIIDNHTSKHKVSHETDVDIESGITRDHTTTRTERTGRATTAARSPSPRENSQERANRKRAELKRNLEEKRKSSVKRKRKF